MPKVGAEGASIARISPDGEQLAVATPDGRVRIFPTDGGACSMNLAAGSAIIPGRPGKGDRLTALCWGWLKEGCTAVFLGSASGTVKALDVTLGELAWTAHEEGEILGLCWCPGQLVYASGAGPSMGVMKPDNGAVLKRLDIGKHPPSHINGIPGTSLVLSGGSALSLWNIEEEELIAKYVGHPTPVKTICFSADGKLGLSAADGERHVSIWNLKTPEKKKNKALCTLSLDSPAKQISTLKLSGKAGKKALVVVAVSDSGIAHVWHCKLKSAPKVEATMWARVSVVDPGRKAKKVKQSNIIFAELEETGEGPAVLVVHGNSSDPIFERIILPPLATEPAELRVNRVKKKQQDTPTATERKKRKREVILGPDNEGEEILLNRMGFSSIISHNNTFQAETEDNIMEGTGTINGMQHQELTLGERMAVLEQRLSPSGASQADEKADLVLKPDSIAVLVSQAVQSGDSGMLDVIYKKNAIRMAASTVRRLSHKDAAGFLDMLISRTQISTIELDVLMEWIRPVLYFHAGFVSSAPGMRQRLSALHQLIDVRLGRFGSILSLAGRLKLLIAQMQMHQNNVDDSNSAKGPEAVFRVGDSSGSEEDDEEVVDAENVGLEDDQAELGGDLHEADPASSSTSSSDSDV